MQPSAPQRSISGVAHKTTKMASCILGVRRIRDEVMGIDESFQTRCMNYLASCPYHGKDGKEAVLKPRSYRSCDHE
jgi:hypothetical protein